MYQITFNYMTSREDGKGGYPKDPKQTPTTDRSLKGRLRVERKGTTGIASIAEGDEKFEEFKRFDMSNADVRQIRIVGLDSFAVLYMKILEIQLEGENLGYEGKFAAAKSAPPGTTPAPPAPMAETAPDVSRPQETGASRIYLIVAVMLLIPLALGIAVVVFLLLRQRKAEAKTLPAKKASAAAVSARKPDEVESEGREPK